MGGRKKAGKKWLPVKKNIYKSHPLRIVAYTLVKRKKCVTITTVAKSHKLQPSTFWTDKFFFINSIHFA